MAVVMNRSSFAWVLLLWSPVLVATASASIATETLANLITSLKGEDDRLFKWNVVEHTAQRQEAGDCSKLADVAPMIVDDSESSVGKDKQLAAEYATLCITDNPLNRGIFSKFDGIHKAVVDMIGSEDSNESTIACHLVYIAAFANHKNHNGFFQQGAVEALGKVVMNDNAVPAQKMWAAAALQNLAASYCETPEDGRCHWEWTAENQHIQLDKENSPLFSDGSPARRAQLKQSGLVDALVELACQEPMSALDEEEEEDRELIMPGYNAIRGAHENRSEVVTWAALGSIKNLALEPTAKPLLESALLCACIAKHSDDWLEESKAFDFLYHMRRQEDPCWIPEDDDETELCVDGNLLDSGFYHCNDYDEASEEECAESTDIFTGSTAADECCACGGGTRFEETGHDEL